MWGYLVGMFALSTFICPPFVVEIFFNYGNFLIKYAYTYQHTREHVAAVMFCTVLVLQRCWEAQNLYFLFHVVVADMPEHGTGHVNIFFLQTSYQSNTVELAHCNCARMCECMHDSYFHSHRKVWGPNSFALKQSLKVRNMFSLA